MKRRILVGLLALAIAAPLGAHDLFMKLDSYYVPSNARVQVALLNGTFDSSEAAVKRERALSIDIVRRGGRQNGKAVTWSAKGDTALLGFRTGPAGTYTLGVSLKPREITMSAQDFDQYLEEDGITSVLAQRRERAQTADSVRERYAKHVKAIVQVGDPLSSGWNVRLGYPAELVPMRNPYAMKVGDTLKLVALVDRKPAAGISVLAGYQRPGSATVEAGTATADMAGVVAIPVTSAGKWYVKFISMRPSTQPKLDYESKWATLTFEIR